MQKHIEKIIQDIFLRDGIPWVIGYSGGKDSTTVISLVWYALKALPVEQRMKKTVHVISTDTLVEQPVMRLWVNSSMQRIDEQAQKQGLPFVTHKLRPEVKDTFWVCMIGHGYAYPRNKYRWCTERLKIKPANAFVRSKVCNYGEVVLVLGTRKSESSSRKKSMEAYEAKRTEEYISPSGSMDNQMVFSPIEDWSTDDVWNYLLEHENPWGISNCELLEMYQGATDGEEFGLTFDQSTKNWGNSRFGCWMCTMVKKDKSMAAMIQNSEEKRWLTPLLDFRNRVMENDREKRDFRRKSGRIHLHNGRLVHGVYRKEVRETLLRELLLLQEQIRKSAPKEYSDICLITTEELQAIRRIWLNEKHEFDDILPRIYTEATGLPFIDKPVFSSAFGADEYELLKQICREEYPEEELLLELTSSVLDIVAKASMKLRRRGINEELEKVFLRCAYRDEEEALEYALKREEMWDSAIQKNDSGQ